MLFITNLESKISNLENLLQDISRNILANILYEGASPSRLLRDSENYLNALKDALEEIKDTLLILNPERAQSIKRVFREATQPIIMFTKDSKVSSETQSASEQFLEYLKMIVKNCQSFVDLAKDIAKNPSKSIAEVLKIKEISEAKNYISRIYVPESINMRLEYLKKCLESFKTHVLNLEQNIRDLLKHINKIEEEISKLQR